MSYAGAAANIVGGELQGWASVLDKSAMNQVYQDALKKQQGFVKQGADQMQAILGNSGSDAAGKDLETGAANRKQQYANADAIPMGLNVPTQKSYSDSSDQAWARMRGQARATLGAYGDWALNTSLNNITNQEGIRQIANFASGDASVVPYQLYAAQHSNDDLAMVGAAISSIGGGAANYAQYASSPGQSVGGGSNMQLNPGGGYTDPYGQTYQINGQGQIFSGLPQQQVVNPYMNQQTDTSLGAGLSFY